MAAAPEKALRFKIGDTNLAFGLTLLGEFGWMIVLAKQQGAGSNNWYYISMSQMYGLADEATDEQINTFCQDALAQANRVLLEEYPVGGVTNPSTPLQKVDAWVMGLAFDSATNQIKRK